MSPERFQQIRDLFERAVELSPEHRRDFLAHTCGEDRELADQVQRMLLADTGPPPDSTTSQLNEAAPLGFPPGSILAQRYRIVSLLGRGGMGEVYRADDLLLELPVALKFLPRRASADAALLSRFRNEVRMARQVTHPNVCRVHDLGEADGLTYLTMEYVDGEDLSSLLRRIGKLPQDKALEVARKIAAGLAAAHEKGVVHRDLKPANIMLDGKGQIRITDFGLAGVAEQIRDPGSGTPAYMSPEQRAGREVTSRSDIYALGIVLHELFTGRRPSDESRDTGLEPAVERVIYRCLEEDPRMRPANALAVVAALPGGDPLAAALRAGELPSPEVVANAGAAGGMKVSTAVACLAVVIIGLTAGSFARQRTILLNEIPIDIPPQVLAAKARDIAKSLGYTERPVDTAFGWEYDTDYLRFLAAEKNDSVRQARIKANRPPAVYFWYRESPRYLFHPTGSSITRTTPAPVEPGMLETVLDSEGRLVEFHARPPAQSREQDLTHTPDWSLLFAAAGLNSGGFTPAQPVLTPESFSDTRAAWTGSLEHAPTELVRVEAAAYQGRPVFFRSAGPWTRLSPTPPFSLGNFTFAFLLLFAVVLPVSVGLLAWRNTRFGRGDRRGAFRLGAFAFICSALKDIAWQHHVPSMSEVVSLLFALRDALTFCACFWLLYVAFEPYVRKRSPATLISWSRLLAGRLRDPLIGADLLAGCVLGIMAVCVALPLKSPFVASLVPRLPPTIASWLAYWSWLSVNAVFAALTFVFLMTLLLLLARLQWLAALLFVLVMSLALAVSGATLSAVILALLLLYAVMRFGVLTTAALLYCYDIVVVFPPPVNPSAWYTQGSLAAFLSILALAVYAFHTTLAGRPIWQDKI